MDKPQEKRLLGRLPAFAVTSEMLADPEAMLASPFFVSAAELAREESRRDIAALCAVDDGEDSEDCGCCPCCGCTCDRD